MYLAESKHRYLLEALASDGATVDGLMDFLKDKRASYEEELHRAAVASLDDENNKPHALRQAGAIAAIDDLMFILGSCAKRVRSKK